MRTKIIAILTGCILIPSVCSADCLILSYGHTSTSECGPLTTEAPFNTSTVGCKTIAYGYIGCSNPDYYPGYQGAYPADPECYKATEWVGHFPYCTQCNSGYQLKRRSITQNMSVLGIERCTQCSSTSIVIDYDECEKCAISCSKTTSWLTSNGKTGYERRTVCKNGCGTYEYRCAAGYYGKPTNDTSGCTKCPSSGNVAGQSVAGSNKAITSCYIPANTSLSDSTGTYQYTSDCYYSK